MSGLFGVGVHSSLLAAAGTALLCAALSDIAMRLIPNSASVSILACGILLRLDDGQTGPSLGFAAVVFVCSVIVWRCGALGGGDVKLLTAASTLIPFPQSVQFLPITAVCGGVLALIYVVLGKTAASWRHLAWADTISRRFPAAAGRSLPYGTAIAAGALVNLAWH